LPRLQGSARRVLDVLHRPARDAEPSQPQHFPAAPLHLLLETVVVRWPGASRPALSGVSLDLPPGSRVAIVGPSGAGKSTLAALLLAFLRPEAGRLLVNGTDARALDGDDIRAAVGWCGQDAHVFDATIGDNVRIGDVGADEPAVRAALGRARLIDWVESLPRGLDTPVGEHGRQLSGGQRQRLALARALLADRQVVVLDEPTEHVEEDCAGELTKDLLAATAGRTTVLVTHRLSGLEELDEVLVLDTGRVVQRGTHAELLAAPGWYRTAWTQQECDRPVLA
jgi:ABC-type multidrug transport system fused ATPase/permease subunit